MLKIDFRLVVFATGVAKVCIFAVDAVPFSLICAYRKCKLPRVDCTEFCIRHCRFKNIYYQYKLNGMIAEVARSNKSKIKNFKRELRLRKKFASLLKCKMDVGHQERCKLIEDWLDWLLY